MLLTILLTIAFAGMQFVPSATAAKVAAVEEWRRVQRRIRRRQRHNRSTTMRSLQCIIRPVLPTINSNCWCFLFDSAQIPSYVTVKTQSHTLIPSKRRMSLGGARRKCSVPRHSKWSGAFKYLSPLSFLPSFLLAPDPRTPQTKLTIVMNSGVTKCNRHAKTKACSQDIYLQKQR